MTTKFVRQCKNLITTMKKVANTKSAEINMGDWILIQETKKPKHFCNTVACVCGYQAISNVLSNFDMPLNYMTDFDSSDIAIRISQSLTDQEDYADLGRSIYEPDPEPRYNYAKTSGIFSKAELKSFAHLKEEIVTPKDVIDYLEFMIDRIESLENK